MQGNFKVDARHRRRRQAAFGIGACVASVVICDLALRLASWMSPLVRYHLSEPWNRNVIPDAVLGKRMSPYYPGHDSRGYRNERALTKADVLAVGDSLTYGFAAAPEGSWPRQLASLSGLSVYNAGVGSYGPCEYAGVLDRLLPELNPKVVLLGIYVGNDIANAYRAVYTDHRFSQWRSSDAAVLAAIGAADGRGKLADLARRFEPSPDDSPAPSLWRYSALFALARSARYRLAERIGMPLRASLDDSFEAAKERPNRVAFDAIERIRTVFLHPDRDALAVDLSDPRINEGWRITRAAVLFMRDKLRSRGARLVVVILHNKPYSYAELARLHQADIGASFFRLVDLERHVSATLENFLQANRIAYVDTAAALRSRFGRGLRPFPESDDPHPNATGYGAVAEVILPLLTTR